jgi:hypothetical protein
VSPSITRTRDEDSLRVTEVGAEVFSVVAIGGKGGALHDDKAIRMTTNTNLTFVRIDEDNLTAADR